MKPKNIAVMLMAEKKKADHQDDEGSDEPSMPPLEEVMQEFIDAVKSGDAKGAAKAFRGAMACSDESEDADESDDE